MNYPDVWEPWDAPAFKSACAAEGAKMGYSISLTTGAASQNEGTPGAAASFTFTVTRQAGDSDGPYTYQFYDVATGGFNTTDFAAAAPFSFDPGVMTKTVTVIAAADATVEASESF